MLRMRHLFPILRISTKQVRQMLQELPNITDLRKELSVQAAVLTLPEHIQHLLQEFRVSLLHQMKM